MKIQNKEALKSVLAVSMGFLVLFFLTHHRWMLITSLIVGISGLLSAYIAEKIDFVWMKFASLLNLIFPKIILTAIFFLILFPLALLSKVFRKTDPLSLKNKRSTLFNVEEKEIEPVHFERTW